MHGFLWGARLVGKVPPPERQPVPGENNNQEPLGKWAFKDVYLGVYGRLSSQERGTSVITVRRSDASSELSPIVRSGCMYCYCTDCLLCVAVSSVCLVAPISPGAFRFITTCIDIYRAVKTPTHWLFLWLLVIHTAMKTQPPFNTAFLLLQ